MSMAVAFLKEYLRPSDLVDVGTMTWLGMVIVVLAFMWVRNFQGLALWGGAILLLNLVPVTVVTAYYEYIKEDNSW